MPWQAQLFIGVSVHDNEEVREVFQKLGRHDLDALDADELEEELWEEPSVKKELWVPEGSESVKQEITIYFQRESEGGSDWPVPRDEAYTDAIVGFALTSRYRPAILDKGHEHGRPEPFEFNPQDILDILEQVHAWWPEAKALLVECFYSD